MGASPQVFLERLCRIRFAITATETQLAEQRAAYAVLLNEALDVPGLTGQAIADALGMSRGNVYKRAGGRRR